MNQRVNTEQSLTKASLGFTRYDVLSRLWENAEWLNDKIHKKQLKITGALRQRVYMVQVQSGVCKTILLGMKDEEFELRLRELEKTLENSVLIPREEERKNKKLRF